MPQITNVKNQGGCGSCWAFAAIAQLEADHAIQNGKVEVLSAQQLTSCTYEASRSGCNGGRAEQAVPMAIRMGGIQYAKDYPYTGGSPPCKYDGDKSATRPVGVWMCPMSGCGTEDIMLEKIQKGPMAVALDAGAYSGYKGGVIGCDGKHAATKPRNHATMQPRNSSDVHFPVRLLLFSRSSLSCGQAVGRVSATRFKLWVTTQRATIGSSATRGESRARRGRLECDCCLWHATQAQAALPVLALTPLASMPRAVQGPLMGYERLLLPCSWLQRPRHRLGRRRPERDRADEPTAAS